MTKVSNPIYVGKDAISHLLEYVAAHSLKLILHCGG